MRIGLLCEEDELPVEPLGYFHYRGDKYPHWGNPRGRNKTVDYEVGKFNRFAKLGVIADEIESMLIENLNNDFDSVDGKCSYACLLMMIHGIRVGNEDSAEGYESGLEHMGNVGELVQTYGVTTLLNKHIKVVDDIIHLHFLGKTQVEHHIKIADENLVKFGKMYLHGHEQEKWIGIEYGELFDFIKINIGDAFIPKDLRTFCANINAWNVVNMYLRKAKRDTKTEVNEEIKRITEIVASRLGNTPSITKSNYIDNRMFDWFKAKRLKADE